MCVSGGEGGGYYAAVDGNLAILSLLTPFSQASAELAGDVTSRDCPGFVPADRGAHVLAQRGGGETAAEKKAITSNQPALRSCTRVLHFFFFGFVFIRCFLFLLGRRCFLCFS